MAARTYVAASDYSDTSTSFTIQTVNDNFYLKIGSLNEADTRLCALAHTARSRGFLSG